jgi:hypothetical protein
MNSTRTDITDRAIPSVRQAGRNPQMASLAKARRNALSDGQVRYVFPTYGTWNIATEEPCTSGLSFYEIHADKAFRVEVAFG